MRSSHRSSAVLRLGLFVVALLVALGVGQFGVYERVIVPRLSQWQHVPWGLWVLKAGAAIAVCLAMGARLRAWRQVAVCACAAALTDAAFTLGLWRSGAPGFKQAYDDGAVEALGLSAVMLPVYALWLSAGFAVGRWWRRRRGGALVRGT